MSTPRKRTVKASTQPLSTTGATSQTPGVAQVICPAAPRRTTTNAALHQTHGAVTSLSAPITSVAELTARLNNGKRHVSKGALATFATLEDYSAYLKSLALHDLHRHAVEEARQVPIDDRERLIRRLETAWTASAARAPGRNTAPIPTRAPFTREQTEAQDELKRKLLRT